MRTQKMWNASRFCVSSLRRGHANLLCIVPILVYVLPKQYTWWSQNLQCRSSPLNLNSEPKSWRLVPLWLHLDQEKMFDPDVIWTRSLLIWSQTRYRCATESYRWNGKHCRNASSKQVDNQMAVLKNKKKLFTPTFNKVCFKIAFLTANLGVVAQW